MMKLIRKGKPLCENCKTTILNSGTTLIEEDNMVIDVDCWHCPNCFTEYERK